MVRHMLRCLVVLVVTTGLVAASSAVGGAEPRQYRLEMNMVVAGYDRGVAAANGFEVRTRPDGSEYSVLRATGAPAGIDEVAGPCGTSYVNFNGTGRGRLATLATGFEVNRLAVAYKWTVYVHDVEKSSSEVWEGELPGKPKWDGYRTLQLPVGPADAVVASIGSFAIMADGGLCVSAGPRTETTIR